MGFACDLCSDSVIGTVPTYDPTFASKLGLQACAIDYLGDATLSARLLEITDTAVQHLANGTDPLVLFGSAAILRLRLWQT